MAPSAAELKKALVQGTRYVYEAEPEGISVNKVRKHVEEKLGLEEGFFTEGKWKSTSKTLIKELVDKLLAADDAEEEEPEIKAGTKKRDSPKAELPQPKRQKRTSGAPTKRSVAKTKKNGKNKLADLDEDEEMEESNLKRKRKSSASKKKVDATVSDASEGSEEKTKPKSKKSAAGRKANPVADSDEEEEEEPESDSVQTKPEPAKQRKRDANDKSEGEDGDSDSEGRSDLNGNPDVPKEDGDDEDTKMDSPEETTVGDSMMQVVGGGPLSNSHATEDTEVMEEDEYSDVIDEPPAAKSKKKGSKETSSKTQASKPSVSKKKAVSVPDDSQEAEIKKLQSQLAKCGIRKFWANEFKQYGSDARAKIRHLKKMLADVGMDGRFSEAKAREIKEMRELLADVEAAQEMNKLWGMSSSERVSRSKSKGKPALVQKTKIDSDSEEEEDHDDGDEKEEEEVVVVVEVDEEEEPTSFAARRRKAHADLAFLGDDSDSE